MKSIKIYFILSLVFVLALSLTLALKDPGPINATGVSRAFFNNAVSQHDAHAQTANLDDRTIPGGAIGQ